MEKLVENLETIARTLNTIATELETSIFKNMAELGTHLEAGDKKAIRRLIRETLVKLVLEKIKS